MDKNSVLVYDSGVGGITALYSLKSRFPFNDYYYMSDSENSPYGNKSPERLFELAEQNLTLADANSFGAVILACNTLSTNCLEKLQNKFIDSKFFGVFPKVEVAKSFNTLLLCTNSTKNSPYIIEAKKKYPSLCVRAVQGLVSEVEDNIFDLNKINLKKYLNDCSLRFEKVLIGCTHFCYLKNKIANYFPHSQIYDGFEGLLDHFDDFMTTSGNFDKNCSSIGKCKFILNDYKRNFEVFTYYFK